MFFPDLKYIAYWVKVVKKAYGNKMAEKLTVKMNFRQTRSVNTEKCMHTNSNDPTNKLRQKRLRESMKFKPTYNDFFRKE